MSAGVFTLQSADVKTVMPGARQGASATATTSPLDGHPAHHPDRADERAAGDHAAARRTSRRRRSGSSASTAAAAATGLRFYVYNLQNQRAEKLGAAAAAGVHRARARRAGGRHGADAGARARRPGTIVNAAGVPAAADAAGAGGHPGADARRRARRGRAAAAAGAAGEGVGIVRNLQVVADKDNNTLLIVATPAEYSVIEAALKKLDVPRAAGDDRGRRSPRWR